MLIRGRIDSELRPIVNIELRDRRGKWLQLEGLLDTGFNGYLAAPGEIVRRLQLPFTNYIAAQLGDGSEVRTARHRGRVRLNEREADVYVLECEGGVMIGMALLVNLVLTMHVLPGAEFTIRG